MKMILNKLSIKDKKIFDKYLVLDKHELAAYAFPNIYIWRKLFDISWSIIEESLCIFFKDNIGVFLYLPPLAKSNKAQVVFRIFGILDKLNKNSQLAHIGNIEEKDLRFYQGLGFECLKRSNEYLCETKDLAGLKGNKFKSKRSSYNYFVKHFDSEFRDLMPKDKKACLDLYSIWEKQRKVANPDYFYQEMLGDSRVSLEESLNNYEELRFKGAVVEVDRRIKGFTFGFELNKETFCILYEITDLSVKGLAQFIFARFSQTLNGYKYINIMDDSGLDNLKRVKLSYSPRRLIPSYAARRKI